MLLLVVASLIAAMVLVQAVPTFAQGQGTPPGADVATQGVDGFVLKVSSRTMMLMTMLKGSRP